jgi:hypothetical protein
MNRYEQAEAKATESFNRLMATTDRVIAKTDKVQAKLNEIRNDMKPASLSLKVKSWFKK